MSPPVASKARQRYTVRRISFAELPEELADPICPTRTSLKEAPFWSEIGLDAIVFYGCVLDSGNTAAENQAMDILRQLKTAHVTLW